MTVGPLAVLGLGADLPSAIDVRQLVLARGGDATKYQGWQRACHGGPDDHPSIMGERALRRALAESGVSASDLKLVISCGASRDYPPPWSMSTEIMRLCGVGEFAVGMDLMAGCLATLGAIDLAAGWLSSHGGGYAAVVAAERWTQTVDYTDMADMPLWAYGDSAGALVLGLGTPEPAKLSFAGAEFCNASRNNGHVFIPYGGTRAPQPEPGVSPCKRKLSSRPRSEVAEGYLAGYLHSFERLKKRLELHPTHLICNQITPKMVGVIGGALGLEGGITITGHQTGHLGGPDIIVGMNAFLASGAGDQTILLGASSAYAFGTAIMITPCAS
jgi:3-oxoacyl-[acyl-carrier-protein] synthase III